MFRSRFSPGKTLLTHFKSCTRSALDIHDCKKTRKLKFKNFWAQCLEPSNCSFVQITLIAFYSTVVYFDQLLGAARTQKLVELLFSAVFNLFCSFQTFFSDFMPEINKKLQKRTNKKTEISWSKYTTLHL